MPDRYGEPSSGPENAAAEITSTTRTKATRDRCPVSPLRNARIVIGLL